MADKRIERQPHSELVITQAQTMYSGPLPSPEEFGRYESVLPGAADRIIAMAEKQAEHRQNLESHVVRSNSRNSTLGVLFAFVLGIITIGGGVFLAYFGRELSGAILGSAGLIGLVSVFIYGTRSSRSERAAKGEGQKQ
jgi:uncharacterized membrane protein